MIKFYPYVLSLKKMALEKWVEITVESLFTYRQYSNTSLFFEH